MNKVLLIGRITRDIDLRKTQTGMSYARFTLAVNRRFKGNNNQQEADFIGCIAWDKRADTMYQYLAKGSLIGVEGRIQTGSYDDKDGKRIYTTDVVVENFDFLESRSQRQQQQAQQQAYPQEPAYEEEVLVVENDAQDKPILDITSDDLPF